MDTCEELMKYLAAYGDGELTEELADRVGRHLEVCERCREEYAGLAAVTALYRESAPPAVPAADWERVSTALETSMSEVREPRAQVRERVEGRRFLTWRLFPAAALAAAVLLVALFVVLPTGRAPAEAYFAEVDDIETGPDYEYIVRLPASDDDFLVIDVVSVE